MRISLRSWLTLFVAAPVALAPLTASAQMAPPTYPAAAPYAAPPYGPPPGYAPAPPPAHAAPAPPPAPDAGERSTSLWYGWQTLIAVAPFDIAMIAGLVRYDQPYGRETFAAGFIGRNLAPGVVHMAHRRPGMGFGSIGLHAASTATGLAIGYGVAIGVQANCPPRDPCRYGTRGLPPGLQYGAVAGSVVGTVLDVIFLAHRSRATFGVTGKAAMEPSVAMAPFVTHQGFGVAAGGMF